MSGKNKRFEERALDKRESVLTFKKAGETPVESEGKKTAPVAE
jgi:hypothetical protein